MGALDDFRFYNRQLTSASRRNLRHDSGVSSDLGTNLGHLLNVVSSAFIRIPFTVAD
jgi:hypothetical protein